jgi:hypothetical protein
MDPTASHTRRAEPPRIPASTRTLDRAIEQHQTYLRARDRLAARSVVRGLILLALFILVASMYRAGFGRVFVPGWWRS